MATVIATAAGVAPAVVAFVVKTRMSAIRMSATPPRANQY
jgi:hypothetical protein